jgi:hypothetical protein
MSTWGAVRPESEGHGSAAPAWNSEADRSRREPSRRSQESGSVDPDWLEFDWEHLKYEGTAQKDIRISDSGNPEDRRIVAFEQGGTHVEVWADLDRSKLLEIVLSFRVATDNQAGWPDDDWGGSHGYPF